MSPSLTHRQAQVLAFVREYLAAHGRSPTVWDICNHFGFSSPRSAAKQLEQLQEKGVIAREPSVHRSIRILDAAPGDSLRQLPLIGRLAAGAPITASEHVKHLTIDPALFTPRADLLFRATGESMINVGILHNDLVAVHVQSEFRDGQVVAAAIRHTKTDDAVLTIKTARRKGSVITLKAENDDQETYAPMVFDTARVPLQIIGVYAGVIRVHP